jgi:hypothetical protein
MITNLKLIAICGPKGSGKSLLSRYLTTHHNYTRLPFSESLKWMVYNLLRDQGASHELATKLLNDPEYKEQPTQYFMNRSPRHVMQTLGTEWGRNYIHDNFWVNIWLNKLRTLHLSKVVVDDLRFVNEAQMIKSLNGFIICLSRPEPNTITATTTNIIDTHVSECEYKYLDYDLFLVNDSTPEQLLRRVQETLGDRI